MKSNSLNKEQCRALPKKKQWRAIAQMNSNEEL
jgi:hypothetical protein